MSSEHFAGLLKQLGESIGLPELKPSEQSLCSLRFDNKVTIDMEANEETGALIFSSILGTILPYQVEKFYPEFLQANLFWVGTGGATLGVDPATLTVFICYQEKLESVTFTKFQDILKGFSETALFWNKRIEEGEGVQPKENFLPSSNPVESTSQFNEPSLGVTQSLA